MNDAAKLPAMARGELDRSQLAALTEADNRQ